MIPYGELFKLPGFKFTRDHTFRQNADAEASLSGSYNGPYAFSGKNDRYIGRTFSEIVLHPHFRDWRMGEIVNEV